MTNTTRRNALGVLGGGAALLALGPAAAQGARWPRRPVTIAIQYGEGGGTDTIIRAIAPPLEEKLGVQIRAINQPGAAGSMATQSVYQRGPDGYWLLGGAEYNKIFRVFGYAERPAWQDWQFMKIGSSTPAWAVHPDSRFQSLAEVVEEARQNPGTIRISNAGIGTIWHEATLVALERETGATFVHVPYESGAAATLAALQGEVDVIGSGVHEQVEYLRAGQIRNLGVFREEPLTVEGLDEPLRPIVEDVPTATNLGIVHGVYAVAAHRDTDPEILQQLHDAVSESVKDERFARVLEQRVMSPEFKGGAEADREAALFESITSWIYYDNNLEGVQVSPAELGIPRPEDFAQWWPPEGYQPVVD